MVHIYKGSKKVDSFYLNSLPIKFIHCSRKTDKDKDLVVDSLGFFERVVYSEMFPIRKNSCIYFNSKIEATNYINKAIDSVSNDERFSSYVRDCLLSYLSSFTVSF